MSHRFHFFLPGDAPGAVGERRTLDPGDTHRIARVLRLRDGEEVQVADAAGRIFRATIRAAAVDLSALLAEAAPPSPVAVALALAGPRADVAIEKLVELGIERVAPLASAGASRPPRPERWSRIARAAAEQAKRPRLATIAPAATLDAALRPGAIMLSHEEPDGSLDDALGRASRPLTLLVGPERGFTAAEHAAARAADVPIASLGRVALRSETAAIVAAVLTLDRLGALRA